MFVFVSLINKIALIDNLSLHILFILILWANKSIKYQLPRIELLFEENAYESAS